MDPPRVIRVAASPNDDFAVKARIIQSNTASADEVPDLKARIRKAKDKIKRFVHVRSLNVVKTRRDASGEDTENHEVLHGHPETSLPESIVTDTAIADLDKYAVPVPGSKSKRMIYPLAPVKSTNFTTSQYESQFGFVTENLKNIVDDDDTLRLKGSGRFILYKLHMVGTSPQTAIPSVVVECRADDEKAIRAAFKRHATDNFYCHTRSTSFHHTNGGRMPPPFRLVYCRTDSDPCLRHASEMTLTAALKSSSTLCGSLVYYEGRTATITLVLDVDGVDRILTVDHIKGPQDVSDTFLASSFNFHDSEESTLNEDDYVEMGPLWIDDDEEEEVEAAVLPSAPSCPNSLQYLPTNTQKQAISSIREMRPVSLPVQLDTSAPYLDWMFLEDDPDALALKRCNLVHLPGHIEPTMLKHVAKEPRIHAVPVYVVSGVRGILKGRLLGVPTYIGSGPGQRLCEAWTVVLDDQLGVISGESGSVIFDQNTLQVYGHVAASDRLGHALVVPLWRTFEQVKTSFNAQTIRLPQKARETTTCPSEVETKACLARGSPTPVPPSPSELDSEQTYEMLSHVHEQAPSARFRAFVKENALPSRSDESKPSTYVPQSVLESYWTREEISDALDLDDSQANPVVETIGNQYLKVFSTLVYGFGRRKERKKYIDMFMEFKVCDSQMPLTTYPEAFPRGKGWLSNFMFEKFRRHQWIFCPMTLCRGIFGSTLADEMILPILGKEPLLRSSAASAWSRIRIHPEYQFLQPSDPTKDAHFTLKTYGREHYDCYAQEVAAYKGLQLASPGTAVVKALSSYTWKATHNIVLEYPDRGTLDDFYTAQSPPISFNDTRLFWTHMSDLLGALRDVRQQVKSRPLHHDIKPDNILCFNSSRGGTEFKFELGDFGVPMSFTRSSPTARQLHRAEPDLEGVGTSERHSRHKDTTRLLDEADVFSFGCILSEAAAWVVLGQKSRDDFLRIRPCADNDEPYFHNLPDPLGFEDEQCAQPSWDHDLSRTRFTDAYWTKLDGKLRQEATQREDVVTTAMLPLIRAMRARPAERPTVRQAYQISIKLLAGVATTPYLRIPVGQVQEWINERKKSRRAGKSGTASLGGPGGITGWRYQAAVAAMKGREQVFVIDDSKSMRPYWDHCVNTFRVLSYVVKQADPRGIELCFSSSPDNWTRYKDTTPAVNAIKKRRDHIYQDDRAISDDVALSSLVEISTDDRLERHRLEAAVQRIMERKSGSGSSARKRTSVDIFIFTDGKWETKAPALTTIECPEFVRCLHVVRFGSPLVTQLSTTASNLQTLVRNQFQDGSQENTPGPVSIEPTDLLIRVDLP